MKSLLNTIIIFGTFVFCEFSSSSDEVTLTTPKQPNSASPKPSSSYRRINVRRSGEISSTPLDLFRVKKPERRSHMNYDAVWKWDFLCQLQPKMGNCSHSRHQESVKKRRQSYYYDAQLDTCLTFVYSGCDGNKNNFPNLVECERHCKGSSYMTMKETKRTTYCALQPNAGICMGLITNYYYDLNEDECKTFVYGGCGGNQNRFETKGKCEERCKQN